MRALVAISIVLLANRARANPAITFTGNVHVQRDELLAAIDDPFDHQPPRPRVLNHEVLERDLLLISALYFDRGHVQVRIGEPTITPTSVVIPIEEGPVFTIDEVAVAGVSPRTRARHRAALRIRTGTPFSRTRILEDRDAITDHYQERGYAYASVVPITKIDFDKRTIAVTFEIERGATSRVERVTVDCPTIVNADAAVVVGVGDRFQLSNLTASKAALRDLGAGEVHGWTSKGSSEDLVVVRFECH